MNAKQKLLIYCGILAVVFVPFPTTVCPEWTLQILMSDGRPYSHANATEHWQYYSVEERGHEEDICADDQGIVIFPKRVFMASLARRVFGAIMEIMEVGVHSSFGSDAYVIASAPGYDNHLVSYAGGRPPKIIRLTDKTDREFPYRKVCK